MTGQAERVSTVTPRRSFLAILSDLAGAEVESLADLLRTFNDQNGVQVAYKAFYNRLARLGFATFIRGMCPRLIEHLRLQALAPHTPLVPEAGAGRALSARTPAGGRRCTAPASRFPCRAKPCR